MRPGLVFVGLFLILMVLYFALRDSLGVLGIFLLQASLVFVILAGAVWFRFARKRKGWLFFGIEDDKDEDDHSQGGSGSAGQAGGEASSKIRKAS